MAKIDDSLSLYNEVINQARDGAPTNVTNLAVALFWYLMGELRYSIVKLNNHTVMCNLGAYENLCCNQK